MSPDNPFLALARWDDDAGPGPKPKPKPRPVDVAPAVQLPPMRTTATSELAPPILDAAVTEDAATPVPLPKMVTRAPRPSVLPLATQRPDVTAAPERGPSETRVPSLVVSPYAPRPASVGELIGAEPRQPPPKRLPPLPVEPPASTSGPRPPTLAEQGAPFRLLDQEEENPLLAAARAEPEAAEANPIATAAKQELTPYQRVAQRVLNVAKALKHPQFGEPEAPPPDESVEDYLVRTLGPELQKPRLSRMESLYPGFIEPLLKHPRETLYSFAEMPVEAVGKTAIYPVQEAVRAYRRWRGQPEGERMVTPEEFTEMAPQAAVAVLGGSVEKQLGESMLAKGVSPRVAAFIAHGTVGGVGGMAYMPQDQVGGGVIGAALGAGLAGVTGARARPKGIEPVAPARVQAYLGQLGKGELPDAAIGELRRRLDANEPGLMAPLKEEQARLANKDRISRQYGHGLPGPEGPTLANLTRLIEHEPVPEAPPPAPKPAYPRGVIPQRAREVPPPEVPPAAEPPTPAVAPPTPQAEPTPAPPPEAPPAGPPAPEAPKIQEGSRYDVPDNAPADLWQASREQAQGYFNATRQADDAIREEQAKAKPNKRKLKRLTDARDHAEQLYHDTIDEIEQAFGRDASDRLHTELSGDMEPEYAPRQAPGGQKPAPPPEQPPPEAPPVAPPPPTEEGPPAPKLGPETPPPKALPAPPSPARVREYEDWISGKHTPPGMREFRHLSVPELTEIHQGWERLIEEHGGEEAAPAEYRRLRDHISKALETHRLEQPGGRFRFTDYEAARQRAQALANEYGGDFGILRQKEFGQVGYNVFRLPGEGNRYGFELKAEVVRPEPKAAPPPPTEAPPPAKRGRTKGPKLEWKRGSDGYWRASGLGTDWLIQQDRKSRTWYLVAEERSGAKSGQGEFDTRKEAQAYAQERHASYHADLKADRAKRGLPELPEEEPDWARGATAHQTIAKLWEKYIGERKAFEKLDPERLRRLLSEELARAKRLGRNADLLRELRADQAAAGRAAKVLAEEPPFSPAGTTEAAGERVESVGAPAAEREMPKTIHEELGRPREILTSVEQLREHIPQGPEPLPQTRTSAEEAEYQRHERELEAHRESARARGFDLAPETRAATSGRDIPAGAPGPVEGQPDARPVADELPGYAPAETPAKDVIDQGTLAHPVNNQSIPSRIRAALNRGSGGRQTVQQVRQAYALRRITQRLAQALDHPIREGRYPFKQKRYKGVYFPYGQVSRLINLSDLDTAAHEAGHHVANKFLGGLRTGPRAAPPPIDPGYPNALAELGKMGRDLYGKRKPAAGYEQEGLSELFKYYVVDQARAQQYAPDAYKWLTEKVFAREPALRQAFDAAHDELVYYQSQPAGAKIATHFHRNPEMWASPNRRTVVANWLNKHILDDLRAFRDVGLHLPERVPAHEDPYNLAMRSKGAAAAVANMVRYGIADRFGKRVSPAIADLLEKIPKGRVTEFKAYLVAERLHTEASKIVPGLQDAAGNPYRSKDILTDAAHLIPRYEQAMTKRIGELMGEMRMHVPQEGGLVLHAGITYPEVRELVEKGRADPVLRQLTDDYRSITKETLRMLVGHTMTWDDFHRIQQEHPTYVDFHRVFDAPDERAPTGGSGIGYGQNTPGVSRGLRGSSRQIVDPIESLVANLDRTVRFAYKHQVFENLVKNVTSTPGLAKLIEEVHAPTEQNRLTLGDEQLRQLAKQMGVAPAQLRALEGLNVTQYTQRQFANARDLREMTIPRIVDGKRRWYKFGDPRLLDAVEGMQPRQAAEFVKWLEIPKRLKRAGTTLAPGFAAGTNIWRDAIDAATYTKGGKPVPFRHLIRGLFEMAHQGDMYHLFELEGGDVGGRMLADREHVNDYLKDFLSSSDSKKMRDETTVVNSPSAWHSFSETLRAKGVDWWLKPLENLGSISERATRIGEVKDVHERLTREAEAKAKKEGRSVTPTERLDIRQQAATAGREVTLNFARGGQTIRDLNRMAAFLKPQVEGLRRFGSEALTGERKAQIWQRMATNFTAPALALYLKQRNDPDYQNTPQWMKNSGLVWIEHNDDGSFKRRWYFPMPNPEFFAAGVVPTRIWQYIDQKNPEALWQLGKAGWDVVPDFLPTALRPHLENLYGKSSFGGMPIESADVAEELPGYRANPETGATARVLGRAIHKGPLTHWEGLSPAKIENYVRGYTGTLGMSALGAADWATRKMVGDRLGLPVHRPQELEPLRNVPILSRFARGPGSAAGGEMVRQFYDTWKAHSEELATYKGKQERHEADLPEFKQEFREGMGTVAPGKMLKPFDEDAKGGILKQAHDEITKYSSALKALQQNRNIDDEEYQRRYRQYNAKIEFLARRALEKVGVLQKLR